MLGALTTHIHSSYKLVLHLIYPSTLVHDGISWSVLGPFGAKSALCCLSALCSPKPQDCSHMEFYISDREAKGIDPKLFTACSDDPVNNVRSKNAIPFPLTPEMQEKSHNLAVGLENFPNEIRPAESQFAGCCECDGKYPWAEQIRVGTANILTPSAVIDQTCTDGQFSEIAVFAGVTNRCQCKLNPDGKLQTLLNVDNKNFITYSCLFLFLSILLRGHPSFNLFAHILCDTYSWSNGKEPWTFGGILKIVRPG